MSYTTIKAIYPGDKAESLEELRNSYGSAPPVWEALPNRYLGTTDSYSYPVKGWMQRLDELWPLWKRDDLPEEYRLVLMFTFDRAYVAKKNYARIAIAIRRFMRDFPIKSGSINHWDRIATLLESNPDIPGIGLYCTSVSEDPFQGPWNEDEEEYGPPNWEEVYEICVELDSLKARAK